MTDSERWVWVETGGRRTHLARVTEHEDGALYLLAGVATGRKTVIALCGTPPDYPAEGGAIVRPCSPPECRSCWRRWARRHAESEVSP